MPSLDIIELHHRPFHASRQAATQRMEIGQVAIGNAPQKYLRTKEAARVVGLCARTLEKHRTYGTGPKYAKIGGRVLYDIDNLRAWIEQGARSSTSDTDATVLPPAKAHAARAPAYLGKRQDRS